MQTSTLVLSKVLCLARKQPHMLSIKILSAFVKVAKRQRYQIESCCEVESDACY
jgi:hypothetical protein